MTDGNDTSSWQSINNQDKAYISISLEQPVYGKQLVFQFGDYRRPGQIAIYKSTDFGRTWQPWHFMVTQQHECTTVFGIPESEIYVLPDENVQRVLCQQYSGYPFDFGEKVVIELNGDIRGDGSNIHEAKALMEWMNVTNVHIRFSGLFRKFDYIDTRWHHYVVSTISMIARCDCNGHGDGLSCPLNKITGNRKCDCLDNTCGDRCERCCPAFNQYPWRKGSRTSWISDNTTACEQCNCHNHSDTCRYDADVAKNKLSLDMKGQYAGGGVCLNCRDNTEGINCEKCQKYFYRPPGVDVTSLDACPPCKCHPAGSRATGQGISYLECVRDQEMALFHDRNVGDCFCRSNVIGTKCDTCKDGFYRLELSNPNGCRSCRCYLAGTFQRLNICHKDFFGQCPCKANVKLRDCSSCKDGYFNLQNDNPNGCTWCDCDVGGSISPYICDKSTGTCTCRAHIKSKRCKEVEDGFYFPDMHYISALRYQYAQATDSLSTKITIPHDSTYKLFIGYTLLTRNIVNVELRMSLEGSSVLLFGPAYPGASLFFCNEECREGFQSSGNGDFILKAGVYQVQIFSQGSNNGLKLERLIAIPLQFMQASILTSEDRTLFQTSCSVEANDLRIGTTSAAVCLAGAFSMTVKFEDGALPCNCNPIGSINSTCNKVAGQCFCKPGVTGRDCSRCSPGFYNFTSHGCQACGCKGVDKICNPQTGECNCPENFQGRVCDACQCNGNSNKCQRDGKCLDCQSNTFGDHCEMCKPSFYGDALQGDCKACGCHAEGAINTTCHMITGQCFCRPGVIGKTCSQCDINHYDLTDTGCKSCRCNEHGSALLQCNNAGVCSCLSSAEGMKCDLCSAGFFGLPDKPCQSCDCNSTGTVTSTTCKNDVHGQCVCKTGVDGRQCDTCRKQYADFGPSGCRECPLCTRKLQRHADEVASKLENVQVDMNLTKQLSTLQKELHQTENYLQTVQLEGVMFENRILRGQRDYNSLHDNKLITWNDRLSKLINQINEVTSRAIGIKPSALSIQQNMEIYYSAAKAASQKTSEAQEIARDVFFSHLMNLMSLASDVVKKGYTYVQDVPTFKFEFYQQTIDDDLTASNTLLGNVTSIGKEVQYQATVASAYLGALAQSEAYFQTKERIWTASMASFLMEIENVHKKGDDVKLLLDQTKEHVDAQRDFISSIQNESQAVDLLLKDNMKLYKLTHGLYEHAFQSTVKIVGGVEVMFLEYNPQNKILRVNVLRGYSLAARDLPSRKADPYFKLSIHPKWFNQGPFQSSPEISTLDPTWQWPIGGTYSFFIRLEQMRETQLVIQVFDGDDENDDDFMGEAVIDMNKILPIILNGATQNTYPLKPQGYSQRWLATFPGPGENGIEDLQNMLSQQIDVVQRLLKETNSTHAKAVEKANQLQSEAQLLKSSFTQAKSLASRAVAAVNTYNQIYRLINSSMLSAMTANQSVQAIQTILKGISVSTFSARANEALLAAQYYLMQVRKRNVTYAGMEIEIRSETFGSNGIHIPPKSSIKINNIEYHPNINGHTILLIDYRTGRIESVQTFRTDIDIAASSAYSAYLSRIPTGKIIIIVKQGEGSIQTADKNDVMSRLLELGGRAPFFSGHRGSYILLGFRLQRGENIPWITQVAKVEAGGASYLKKTITLKSTLKNLLHSANVTFNGALPQWSEIKQLFPVLKKSVLELTQEASAATVVQAALDSANIMVKDAVRSATQVLKETQALLRTVDELTLKYEYLMTASSNVTKLVVEGQAKVLAAENKIQSQSSSILKAVNIQDSFTTINNEIHQMQSSMTNKFNTLQNIASELPFTINFQTGASATYSFFEMTSASYVNKLFITVQFDVKAHTLNGVLWYLVTRPAATQKSGVFGLYLQQGYVYTTFNMGSGDVTGRSNALLKIGEWYRISATFSPRYAYLVVRSQTGFSTLSRISTFSSTFFIPVNGDSRWYLNNVPQSMSSWISVGSFSGIYDNVHVNGYKYNVWKSVSTSGVTLYAPLRMAAPKLTNGSALTFFGTGYLKQRMGTFQTNGMYSEIELEFRTLKDNVVIVGVTGQTGSFVYGLYMFGGRVMFQFATSQGNNNAIVTTRASYNNGQWYRVKASRTGVNATLSVQSISSGSASESKTEYIGLTDLPEGKSIIFGASSGQSPVPPPVSGVFAGDMKNLKLSNSITSSLQMRSFNASENIEMEGVSYYGMISGKIVNGIRFYGYMWWSRSGSYASITTYQTVPINSIFMSFKTTDMNGLLLYKPGNGIMAHLYMSILSGNLVVLVHLSDIRTPFMTTNLTLSDGRWHNASIAYTKNGYQIHVDNKMLYEGWLGNNVNTMFGTGMLYVGGVPSQMPLAREMPIRRSLQIDFDSFLVNLIEQDFTKAFTSGVSYAGITPGHDSAVAPSSCAASFPYLMNQPDPLQVRFGRAPWSGFQSYIGYRLPAAVVRKYFNSSFVITMSFRAMVGNGVIFYIANSEINPTQYISLELVKGQLKYEFSNGKGKVSISSANGTNYADNGKWYKVYLLRIYQFGAMLIPETMEYRNSRHSEPTVPLSLSTPLYIGGLPNYVNAPSLTQRKYGYNGCLRKFEISSGFDTHALDFTSPDLGGTSTGTSACYSNTEHGVFFNGKDSWIHYANNFELQTDFTLQVKFRTYKRDGPLLYLFSTSSGSSTLNQFGTMVLLELDDGSINFHYKANNLEAAQTFTWTHPSSDERHYLCDQKWHRVKIEKSGPTLNIIVDDVMTYGGGNVNPMNRGVINGMMFVGGTKSGISIPSTTKNFEGCVELEMLGTPDTTFQRSVDGNNVVFACPTI